MKNLLVELFVEELPPKALKKIGEAFACGLETSLKAQGLLAADSKCTGFASPRRLGAHISTVEAQAADKPVAQKLMPASVGLDANGKATPALLKKLAALGANESAVPNLKRENDGKADVLFFNNIVTGTSLDEGLQKALEETLAKLPIPKVMNYQLTDGWETVNFVRPAHGLVALHGNSVVNVWALGLKAGNASHGHRFEAGIDPVLIKDADSYEAQMENEGAVIPSFLKRRAEIAHQLAEKAAVVKLKPIEDEALLDEVTGLVERPNVLIGQFEEVFLEVPQECLILTMKVNQKYFPLLDASGKLSNKFLIVSNIRPADTSAVIGGNERVVRPRLADAKFFFDQDRKKPLASRVEALGKVVYHNRLGTQGQRLERVRQIARAIAERLGIDVQLADTAARLAKADLLTDMVGEFPELQGIMGRYYALHDGLPESVADAIEDHYKPRFAGDELPRNPVGVVVALADKLETLVGLFGIGQIPTGDKDPFALRRHALGVIRMLIERHISVELQDVIDLACKAFSSVDGWLIPNREMEKFIFERLAVNLRDQGYSAQEVDAVLSLKPQKLANVVGRLVAVRAFAALPEAPALAAANKRVGNILKKAEGGVTATINTSLLKESAEIALNSALKAAIPQADTAFEHGDYTASLRALAALKAPVDAFFNDVMVNVDDTALRNNRLGLLATLHQSMNRVADISKLAS